MTSETGAGKATERQIAALCTKLVELGLFGAHFSTLLEAFCLGVNDMGIAVARAHISLRAVHPEFGSTAHRWERDTGAEVQTFDHVFSPRQDWVQSPLYYLMENDMGEYRQRLDDPTPKLDFPIFDEFRARNLSDYIAFKFFFARPKETLAIDPNSTPEGCMISLCSDALSGFSDAQLDALRATIPSLLLALKSDATRQMAIDITDTYLGRDAGSRVLSGDIVRGSVRALNAVICYFDLSGFTKLSEERSGADIIELLNDYFGMAVDVVQDRGGNVLKFMGDGMLAIFDPETVKDAPLVAIKAAVSLREGMATVNARRAADGISTTGFTLAVHTGEVLYGNIGGKTRLDFTVIGPAVNTTARLSGMCAHVDQQIIISADVAKPFLQTRPDLVSLGQYRLRGVKDRQELFTLD